MHKSLYVSLFIGLCVVLGISLELPSTVARASTASAMKAYDTDADGTLSAKEVTAAAGRTFDMLDTNKDGTLDANEMRGRMTSAEFASADMNHDGSITKSEYIAAAMKDFKAADVDQNGTLDAKEMASPPGLQLQKLIQP